MSISPATSAPVPRIGSGRDRAIEGLRGLAAVMVFMNHLLVDSINGWAPSWHWSWGTSGPAAVMIFFVLSGYVIGLGYRPTPGGASAGGVGEYLRRRAVRLIPINCVAVLLACAVAEAVDWPTVLGNLFFLQNFGDYAGVWILVLRENMNLWSLNYEVVFYLAFAVIWGWGASLGWTLALSVVLGVLGWLEWGVPLFLGCYALGFLFWLAGLWLAWRATPTAEDRGNWPTCLLLALITWKLQGLAEILIPLDATLPRFAGPVVKLYHLDFLPVSVWLVAMVARRTFRGLKAVMIAAAVLPLVGIGTRGLRGGLLAGDTLLIVAVYLLAIVLWQWRPTVRWFEASRRWDWFPMRSMRQRGRSRRRFSTLGARSRATRPVSRPAHLPPL